MYERRITGRVNGRHLEAEQIGLGAAGAERAPVLVVRRVELERVQADERVALLLAEQVRAVRHRRHSRLGGRHAAACVQWILPVL